MATYPELQGMPADCLDTDPTLDILEVRVPYRGVDESVVTVPPFMASYDQLLSQLDNPETTEEEYANPPGLAHRGLGYDSGTEEQMRESLRVLAHSMATNIASYHPSARPKIVDLSKKAKELMEGVRSIYREHREGPQLRPPANGEGVPAIFGLDRVDDELVDLIGTTYMIPSDYFARRAADRAAIREAYDRAVRYLWCALLGKAQSESLRENTRIWTERNQGTGGRPGLRLPSPGGGGSQPLPDVSRFGIGVVGPGGGGGGGGGAPGGEGPPMGQGVGDGGVPGGGGGEPPPSGGLGGPCDPDVPPPDGFICMLVGPGVYMLVPAPPEPGEPPSTDVTGSECDPMLPPPAGYQCVEIEAGRFVLVPAGVDAGAGTGGGAEAPAKRKQGFSTVGLLGVMGLAYLLFGPKR